VFLAGEAVEEREEERANLDGDAAVMTAEKTEERNSVDASP